MKAPRLCKNYRDGIWFLSCYVDKKRKRLSLHTCDQVIASWAEAQLTGFQISPVTEIPNGNNPASKSGVSFVEAVNKFIKSKWGLNDAWMHNPKPQCNKPEALALYIFKRLQCFF